MDMLSFFALEKHKPAPATQTASPSTKEMWQRLNGRAIVAVDLLQVDLTSS